MLNYVLTHFYRLYPKAKDLPIYYGEDSAAKGVFIRQYEGNFFEGKVAQPEQVVWQEWNGTRLPFFFDQTSTVAPITYTDGRALINYDIIASAFFLLSGWQEYHSSHRDRFGRFPYKASVQATYGFINVPVVNYYFDMLKEAIQHAFNLKLELELWPNASFASCLTHDIDRLTSAWKVAGLHRFKQGKYLAVGRLVTKKLLRKDAWDNISELMALANQHQLKSTYFWMANNQKYNGHPNADYLVELPKYQLQIKKLLDKGHEIGIHGSFGTSNNSGQLLAEAVKIGAPVTGNRFHYLQYKPELTPQVLSETFLQYDSTLGFAEQLGFRNSFCHPFFPYDFKNRKACHYIELPLILMDVTLYSPNYMQLRPAEALPLVRQVMQEIKKFNGLFTLLWHNENISDYSEYSLGPHEPNWREVLNEILLLLRQEGSTFLTCAEAATAFNGGK
ncbi:polysaccharide deacetylase family protein [Pontibacter sp. 13R65]|uniref:polysaccharide deacetylase family protein n=1 Tax=Pontibacter sp. 13R65 TaxID=3127458 RepID=UPI00301CC28B